MEKPKHILAKNQSIFGQNTLHVTLRACLKSNFASKSGTCTCLESNFASKSGTCACVELNFASKSNTCACLESKFASKSCQRLG